MPLANASVNMAGQPSKVGGTITRVVGWVVLVLGTLVATGTFAACSSIVGAAAAAPYLLAFPLAVVTWVLSYFLSKGGKQLEQAGVDAQRATRTQAVFALANTRAGMVTPSDLAQAIGITAKEADDHLTAMAKESPEHVSIEVDESGTIFYRFNAAHWQSIASNPANWERSQAHGGYVQRVAPPAARVDDIPNVRVEPRDAIDDDLASDPDLAAQRRPR